MLIDRETPRPLLFMTLGLILSAAFVVSCGPAQNTTPTDNESQQKQDASATEWTCNKERDGWKRCASNNRLQSCHGEANPHFDTDERCADAGGTCVDSGFGSARCEVPENSEEEEELEEEEDNEPLALSLSVTVSQATLASHDGQTAWGYAARDGTRARIAIENYLAAGGAAAAGTFELKTIDRSYATCAFCVIVETDCKLSGSDLSCTKTYMPESGSYSLSELDTVIGGHFAGTLDDILFQQVRIDAHSLKTTPVAGARKLRLAEVFAWDDALTAPPAPVEECGGHGHAHGNHCHCDPGYESDPADPMNCIPE